MGSGGGIWDLDLGDPSWAEGKGPRFAEREAGPKVGYVRPAFVVTCVSASAIIGIACVTRHGSNGMRTMLPTCVLALATSLVLAGCNPAKSKEAATQAVMQFHQRLDNEAYAEIYRDAHPDFKKASTEKDFTALLEAVHRKLGNTVSSEPAGWRVNSFVSGTNVVLTYKTKFAAGDAVETFSYREDGATPALLGYNINSTALILK